MTRVKALFHRKDPQLGDYFGLGLFVLAYVAVVALIFLPRFVDNGGQADAVNASLITAPTELGQPAMTVAQQAPQK